MIRPPARPELSQQHLRIHAGATSAIVDKADGYAALAVSRRISCLKNRVTF